MSPRPAGPNVSWKPEQRVYGEPLGLLVATSEFISETAVDEKVSGSGVVEAAFDGIPTQERCMIRLLCVWHKE